MGKGVKPQIVEILAPDDESSGSWAGHAAEPEARRPHAPAPRTDAATPGRRPVWIVAALGALVAVIAAVALTSGGSPGRTAAPSLPTQAATTTVAGATPASTTAPRRTVVTSGQVARPEGALKIVPVTPAGFRVTGASEFYPNRATDASARQLWADASPHGDRPPTWFEVDATTGPAAATGVAHVATLHGVVTVLDVRPGWLSIAGPIDGGSAQITSSGLGLAQLVGVLDSATYHDGVLHLGEATVPVALSLVATTERDIGAQGTAALSDAAGTTISYSAVADAGEWIQLTAGGARPSFDATAFEFRLRERATIDLGDGRIAETFSINETSSIAEPGLADHYVRLSVGGVPVEILGAAPLGVLVELARSAQVASDGAWIILQHQAHDTPSPISSNGPLQWTLIGGGATSRGSIWSVDMINLPGAEHSYAVQAGDDSTSVAEHSPAPSVRVIALPSITIVVARMPRREPGATLIVKVAGADYSVPVDTDFAGVEDLVGVLTFEEVGLPVAQIVDAAGTVRAAGPTIPA